MNKKQLWERKLAQRDKKLTEAYDDYVTATTADGKQVSASASTRSTRTYNYEDVEFEFDARKGFGTYRWMNRPWQRFDFASALQKAMIDAGVDEEFARECIEKSGSLRSAIEFFAKNYKVDKKEVDKEEPLKENINKEDLNKEIAWCKSVLSNPRGRAAMDAKANYGKNYVSQVKKDLARFEKQLKESDMMNESHDDKELLDAVMDSFGFTEDEALEYIKKASDKTKQELVKGFRQDAKKNFYNESAIEDDDKVYQIKYWLTEEDREEGFSDIFIDSFDSKQEAIMTAKKMVDRGDVASVEVFDAEDVTEQPVYFYDGNEENCPECGGELGKDGRCYNSDCGEYDPLSQYFDDEDKTDLDESAQKDRKELNYLWRKEKVTSLDKYEMHRLQELIQMYGRPDENKNNSLKENKQLNEMIVDLILDRKDGEEYSPENFYRNAIQYNSSFEGIADEITRAMDSGTEEDVKRALCKYIEDNEYSKSICDYINSVKWLNEEKDLELKEEKNNNKGAKIASIIASALNKQGGHGPWGNEEVVADGNTITLVSQAGLETYKFNDDGSVDNLSIDDMIKTMLEDGDIEESEIEDIREEYGHFNSIKDLLQSNLTWFMELPEKLIIKKVEVILGEEKDLEEARGAGKGQKLDKYYRMVDNLYKDNLSKEEIERLEKTRAEVEKFEPKSEYEKRDKKNLLDQIAKKLKDGTLEEAIDLDKHVWEGWTVQDFIDELEPLFDQVMSGGSWIKPFKDKAELKAWCIDNQPYYKRYIPGVVEYFFKKMKKNENLNEKLVAYDPAQWESEDIELHKSIDWKERNWEDFVVEDDSFETDVMLYGLGKNRNTENRKTVEVFKTLRANPIYPPYYGAIEQPFIDVVGPMFNGNKHGKYSIHDRYETQEHYDSMFN